jgi:ribosomal protein S18 acetylase RimI-like enzyme
MIIKEIKLSNKEDILVLLENSKSGVKNFRYFAKRPLEIIANHRVTIIGYEEDFPVAYGHLDQEGEKIWLGVLVADKYHRRGFGSKILDYLLNFGKINLLRSIFLSVDNENLEAISLYLNKGFIKKEEGTSFSIFEIRF